MHALHKQASMSAAEFQRWGQRVVYHSAGAAMHDLNLNASTMMMADKASDLIRGRTAPEAVVVGSIAG
jgi:choline dehydrogenase